jgi:hypothetical protein
MRMHDDPLLKMLEVKAADRNFQVWERNSLSVDLFTAARVGRLTNKGFNDSANTSCNRSNCFIV